MNDKDQGDNDRRRMTNDKDQGDNNRRRMIMTKVTKIGGEIEGSG
jgi:hypothetical protein